MLAGVSACVRSWKHSKSCVCPLNKTQSVRITICGFTGSHVWDYFLDGHSDLLESRCHHQAAKQKLQLVSEPIQEIVPHETTNCDCKVWFLNKLVISELYRC